MYVFMIFSYDQTLMGQMSGDIHPLLFKSGHLERPLVLHIFSTLPVNTKLQNLTQMLRHKIVQITFECRHFTQMLCHKIV